MMIMPFEIAGVAIKTSFMAFWVRSLYVDPALTTKTSPSSLQR